MLLFFFACELAAERGDTDKSPDSSECADPTLWYADADGDGFGTSQYTETACDRPSGYVLDATDCDDTEETVSPSAPEYCDGVDQNCNGEADEGAAADAPTWFADTDADGFGDPNNSIAACTMPAGYSELATDCDDLTASIYPGAGEYCNTEDDNCDGETDEAAAIDAEIWFADPDGFGDPAAATAACEQSAGYTADNNDCDDLRADANPIAAEVCNGLDDDCDDLDPNGHPGAIEVCDDVDNDCSTGIDDDAVDMLTWFADDDDDGIGDPAVTTANCNLPVGYSADNTDCDDATATNSHAANETCTTTADDNCDGVTSEIGAVDCTKYFYDGDRDGAGLLGAWLCMCVASGDYTVSGVTATNDDCDDSNSLISPFVDEICGGGDENCDGLIDDADASVGDKTTWYADVDADGFGDAANPTPSCSQPAGTVGFDADYNDGDPTINPGELEVCGDGLDNDCEGTDETCGGVVTMQGIDFVNIAASTFEMGCTAGQSGCQSAETLHTVTLTQDYYVSETEVTQAQFEDVIGYNPSNFTTCGDECPVERVDWHESAAFANALSTAAGLEQCYACTGSGTTSSCSAAMDPYSCEGYRLLTEAEWEGAARCGDDLLYAGSVTAGDVAWYGSNSANTTHAVGQKTPNACGLYDMSGNVYEWTQDWYGTLLSSAAIDPIGAVSGSVRVIRGGDWTDSALSSRISYRSSSTPTDTNFNLGIRLARSNP